MTKMRGGLNLIPNILKKHEAGRASGGGGSNDSANDNQAKKRANLSAKNKVSTEILALKRAPPKEGENQTRVFGPKYHVGFKIDKIYHWCPPHMMWCAHTAAECTKVHGQDVKQQAAKKKKKKGQGKGRKGRLEGRTAYSLKKIRKYKFQSCWVQGKA